MRRLSTALRVLELAESHSPVPFRRPQRTEAIKTSAAVLKEELLALVAATPPNQQDARNGTRRVVDLFVCRERTRGR
jgi:hypothetical protein